MIWPVLWAPITDNQIASALEVELQGELGQAHQLFGLPLQVIGRRLDSNDVLAAVQDGSGRVASVHLTWSGTSESPPWPNTDLYESFEAWEDDVRNSTTADPGDELEIVRAALRKWDPIGVHPEWPECPAKDEYDRYAPDVLAMLRAGATEADLAHHLCNTRTERMAVSWAMPGDSAIASELFRWWSVQSSGRRL